MRALIYTARRVSFIFVYLQFCQSFLCCFLTLMKVLFSWNYVISFDIWYIFPKNPSIPLAKQRQVKKKLHCGLRKYPSEGYNLWMWFVWNFTCFPRCMKVFHTQQRVWVTRCWRTWPKWLLIFHAGELLVRDLQLTDILRQMCFLSSLICLIFRTFFLTVSLVKRTNTQGCSWIGATSNCSRLLQTAEKRIRPTCCIKSQKSVLNMAWKSSALCQV